MTRIKPAVMCKSFGNCAQNNPGDYCSTFFCQNKQHTAAGKTAPDKTAERRFVKVEPRCFFFVGAVDVRNANCTISLA